MAPFEVLVQSSSLKVSPGKPSLSDNDNPMISKNWMHLLIQSIFFSPWKASKQSKVSTVFFPPVAHHWYAERNRNPTGECLFLWIKRVVKRVSGNGTWVINIWLCAWCTLVFQGLFLWQQEAEVLTFPITHKSPKPRAPGYSSEPQNEVQL